LIQFSIQRDVSEVEEEEEDWLVSRESEVENEEVAREVWKACVKKQSGLDLG
jgi:hypothetical protein